MREGCFAAFFPPQNECFCVLFSSARPTAFDDRVRLCTLQVNRSRHVQRTHVCLPGPPSNAATVTSARSLRCPFCPSRGLLGACEQKHRKHELSSSPRADYNHPICLALKKKRARQVKKKAKRFDSAIKKSKSVLIKQNLMSRCKKNDRKCISSIASGAGGALL